MEKEPAAYRKKKLTNHSRQNVNSAINKLIKMNLVISTVFKTCHGKVLSTQVNIAELNELLKRYEKKSIKIHHLCIERGKQ